MMDRITVVVDTREQEPYSFDSDKVSAVRKALPAGDYSLVGLEERVAVERKSLTHLSDSQLKDAVARIWQLASNAWMGERAMTTESEIQLAVELAIDNGAFEMQPVAFHAYTVIDADAMERFSTTDFQEYDTAIRERNRLNLTYGKQFCLRVAGIDGKGQLHEIDEDE